MTENVASIKSCRDKKNTGRKLLARGKGRRAGKREKKIEEEEKYRERRGEREEGGRKRGNVEQCEKEERENKWTKKRKRKNCMGGKEGRKSFNTCEPNIQTPLIT